MWDCHSCDPGSNPGPGVQPKIRIPTSINNNNNKEINHQISNIKIQNNVDKIMLIIITIIIKI
jgi:hypothetical protein